MKKILLIILLLFSFYGVSFATDACDKFIPQEASFIGEATISARFRDYPCTYKSNIIGSSTIGENYTITQKVDGWYKIESELGNSVWIWDEAIKKVGDIVVQEKVLQEEGYLLTIKDRVIINKLFNSLNDIIQKRGYGFKELIIGKIDTILNKNNLSERLEAILLELNTKLESIEIKTEEVILVYSENYLSEYNIDLDKVKETWLSWYNTERKLLGKDEYIYNLKLEQTSIDWSNISKTRGDITHKRDTGDSYYDYTKITNWFDDRGVVCKNINTVTHTENIGWGTYSCNDTDCTEEFLDGIKSTFDYYMSEKDKEYKAHYLSIMNDYFTKIGIGFAIEEYSNNYNKYYLTVHYCTELVE